ncbi:MAG: DUF59 domain-containing protein [Proteobacteria bacterium]|nr:DUF59 domain-containing protein [Pseudomonadota bacterium]
MSNPPPPLSHFMPAVPAEEGLTAKAGKPLAAGAAPASEADVVAAIRTVYDPEIPVNLYDLGLIYELDVAASGAVYIEMTLTAPACPVAGEMPQQVADAVAAVPGVGEVEVVLVWTPPWTPALMSEDAKLALDMDN